MLKKIRKFVDEQSTLEEKVFAFILITGTVIVFCSAVVTLFEELSIYAALGSVLGSCFFIFLLVLNFKFKKQKLARLLLCYFMNCILIPVLFFACGGIDSGMILYALAALFVIIPTLNGKARLVCFCVSLITHICTIGVSYNFIDGTKAKTKMSTIFLAKLSIEDRIIDLIASLSLVSVFLCVTTALILKAYQREREKKEDLLARLDMLARKDELTGLYNRRELFRKLEQTELFAENAYCLVMLDIDHFKSINDTYGHVFGDTVLRTISAELIDRFRRENGELAARYGGEEFVLLLKNNGTDKVAERIDGLRKTIGNMKWEEAPKLSVTISGGIVKCHDYTQISAMLSGADKLLYSAKEGGRNRICHKL